MTAAVLVAAMAAQLWRVLGLEVQLQRAELTQARLEAERLLQRAARSPAVMAALPPSLRCVVRGDRVVVDATVAWLEPPAFEAERDVVVEDRLARAERAEFVERDAAAAAREFDVLLARGLPPRQQLAVLTAAAWQAQRGGDEARRQQLSARLRERVAALTPADLGSALVANSVAAARTLLGPSEGVDALLPYLPRVQFAGAAAGLDAAIVARHADVATRRERLRAVQAAIVEHPATVAELRALGDTDVLWALSGDGGELQVAVVAPSIWFDAVVACGEAGELSIWPRRVAPRFGEPAAGSFAGVPGLLELDPVNAVDAAGSTWILPALTVLMAFAFVLALRQQLRAGRVEVAALAAQQRFLTTVTHELKTPLAGIRLLAEMLAEGRAAGRETQYYRLLVGEAGRLSMLIENVLDVGRMDRGERPLKPQRVELGELVDETLQMFVPVAERDGLVVAFDPPDRSVHVLADRSGVVQALVAVLDNARKYAAEGRRIDVRIEDDGSIVVRDHGPGIPAVERERVFERFVRGERHAHGSTPGVGIGLYLARSILRGIGGDLRCATPVDGVGAEFQFLLPAIESPA